MTRDAPTTLNYFTAPPAGRARFVVWIIGASSILAGTCLWMLLLRGDRILNSDLTLIGGWTLLSVAAIGIAVLLRTTPGQVIRLTPRTSWWIIIGGTILLQALAVLLFVPALSDDVLRFRLDGRMWISGRSPYAITPAEYVEHEVERPSPRLDVVDALVPFFHLHTIYPPVAQLFFVIARASEEAVGVLAPPLTWFDVNGKWRDWIVVLGALGAMHVHRTLIAIVAAVSALTLLSVLDRAGRSAWWAILLAWNPLFVIETGGMGHVDIVGVLFVLLTIRALQSHRPILATVMLALAAGVKPHVVLLAPFLWRDALAAGSRVRARWLAVSFISFVALLYSPMLYQQGYKGWLKTSHIYATSWEANGSTYDLIKASADETDGVAVQRAKDRARSLAGAVVAVTMLIAWFGRADLATAGYWVFLVALLFSPVVYPWYLLWVLCFVPLLRGWQGVTALVWGATVGVSYLLWRTSDWVLPMRWLLVEYVPVYLTLATEIILLASARKAPGSNNYFWGAAGPLTD